VAKGRESGGVDTYLCWVGGEIRLSGQTSMSPDEHHSMLICCQPAYWGLATERSGSLVAASSSHSPTAAAHLVATAVLRSESSVSHSDALPLLLLLLLLPLLTLPTSLATHLNRASKVNMTML